VSGWILHKGSGFYRYSAVARLKVNLGIGCSQVLVRVHVHRRVAGCMPRVSHVDTVQASLDPSDPLPTRSSRKGRESKWITVDDSVTPFGPLATVNRHQFQMARFID